MTHTYIYLDLSRAAYQEIREALLKAGYEHVIHVVDGREVIDMHGIAVRVEVPE